MGDTQQFQSEVQDPTAQGLYNPACQRKKTPAARLCRSSAGTKAHNIVQQGPGILRPDHRGAVALTS